MSFQENIDFGGATQSGKDRLVHLFGVELADIMLELFVIVGATRPTIIDLDQVDGELGGDRLEISPGFIEKAALANSSSTAHLRGMKPISPPWAALPS